MLSMPIAVTLLALIAYLAGFFYLLRHLLAKSEANPILVWTILITGLVLHAYRLSLDMFTIWGINYDVFNLFSFTSGFVLTLGIIFSFYRPVLALLLMATPITMAGLLVGSLFNSPDYVIRQQGFGIDVHIILSLTAYTVLFLAAIHSVLIWFQDKELKKKKKKRFWISLLPSLQTMESTLFDLILVGFILLTIA